MRKVILTTKRLVLREFSLSDQEFILELVNTPDWIKFIGDKKVYSLEDAKNYLEKGPINSYNENGYGLWLAQLKDTGVPIGTCGLISRETLTDVDIGFALLPKYYNLGYGFEIADATLKHAKSTLKLKKIVAITDPVNHTSIKLLEKIGLHFEKDMELSDGDKVLLFST